jgi:uncharacterized protein
MPALAPVTTRERVITLDVLRGFALLGVLIGNTCWLYSARALEEQPDAGRLNAIARWSLVLLVESKSQTLLTFLFGFGFAVQLLRAQERNEPVMGLYLRRLFALFAIGLLHVMLWWGDVTWTYAVAGFGLLLFQRVSNRTRVIWAFMLIFVPFAFRELPSVRAAASGLVGAIGDFDRSLATLKPALHGNRFLPIVAAHLRFAIAWATPAYQWYFAWLVGHFLLGYVAGKQRWFDDDGAHHLPLFRKLLVYGLIADLPSAAFNIVAMSGALEGHKPGIIERVALGVIEQIGLLGLTAVYVAIVVLLMQRQPWRRLLAVVAPVGRMPLTTYVSQSLICTFLFYGWGLGWAGKVGLAGCVGLALTIFVLQVVASHLWLRNFRFGPLDWVWRALVYQRFPPMRL